MHDKVWLDTYESGVPESIGKIRYDSVAAYMRDCCGRYIELPALVNFGVSLSYAEFEAAALQLAGFFQSGLTLSKGDRLAIMLPNLLQYPVTLFGALDAGLVVVNVNPAYTQRELLVQLRDCGARAIVVFAGCAHLLQEILDQTPLEYVIVTEVGDLFPRARAVAVNFYVKYIRRKIPAWNIPGAIRFKDALKTAGNCSPVPLAKCDPAFLQYTGGTTGLAKGAVLSHGNILANVEQTNLWIRGHLREGQERAVVALPLYHIFGLTINFLSNLQFGAAHFLITDPRNTKDLIGTLKKSNFTVFAGVNTLFAKLLAAPAFRKLDFQALRMVIGGGAAVQTEIADRWEKLTGVPICQAYGLTEASPGVSCNPLDLAHFNGSVGLPVPSTRVKVCDDAGRSVGSAEVGELYVKGPQVMQGYWDQPEETQRILSSDGWLKTGDIATIDEKGFIRIVDRKKDLINISGFNVYPNEVEEVLIAHPAVADAGVVGKPHEVCGEMIVAFVVKADQSLSRKEIERFCRQNLVSYKVPKEIQFVSEIPKSNIGKVMRRKLRDP